MLVHLFYDHLILYMTVIYFSLVDIAILYVSAQSELVFCNVLIYISLESDCYTIQYHKRPLHVRPE